MSDKMIINGDELQLILERLCNQVLEGMAAGGNWAIVGIQRRGADLALRMRNILAQRGISLPCGSLDINLYRDDWTRLSDGIPRIGQSTIPFNPDGKTILLVDDVLYTGRTIRSALEALLDYGRPARVRLLALVDRGNRELPIQADYVGQNIATAPEQHIDVLLSGRDGQDAVLLRG